MSQKVIRIGNAGGYWGDDPRALERQVLGGKLDYITMDFLAEITMSIMQKQRAREPHLGYARDFLGMLQKILPQLLAQKTCVITNAGGINPTACAKAITEMAAGMGLFPKIAVVHGDDILTDVQRMHRDGIKFQNMETGEAFDEVIDRLQSANVYFGATAVVEALAWKPDIIVTGRVTDTGITLAPMIFEHGWALNDWNKLAAGIVAGHILECGTQSTGGNFTDWEKVPSFDDVGFPIAEVAADGTVVITKHPGSGGMVSVDTVREQLFYEMGNPRAYITPDVVADFATIQLGQDGKDRVKVTGVKGYEPTPFYKVSMAYADGFKSVGSIVISGPNARKKAEAFAKIFWNRCQGMFAETETEFFGWNACHRSLVHQDDGNEIMLRLGVRSDDKEKLAFFGKMIPSLILSGPPGVSVMGGVPKPQEVVSYWPALMPKSAVLPKIALVEKDQVTAEKTITTTPEGNFNPSDVPTQTATKASRPIAEAIGGQMKDGMVPLSKICLGRSGDKGDMANIGIMARSPKAFEYLDKHLTAQVVKDLFQEICHGPVVRYTLSNMQGFNFLLEASLGGGGTKTLRVDAQGKTFAQGLLRQKFNIPAEILADITNT